MNRFIQYLLGILATLTALAGFSFVSNVQIAINFGPNSNIQQRNEPSPAVSPSPGQLPPTNQSAPVSTPTPAPSPAEQSKTTAPTEVEKGNASEETADNVEPENLSNSEVEAAPTTVAEQPKRSRKPRPTYRTANNYDDSYQDVSERSDCYCPTYPVTPRPARSYNHDVEFQQAPPPPPSRVYESEFSEETFSDGSTTITIRRSVTRRSGGTVRIIQPPINVIDN